MGQVPIYYSHASTGRPSPKDYQPLTSSGAAELPAEFQYRSHYLDSDPTPLFPFGYGLSYASFAYRGLHVDASQFAQRQEVEVRVEVANRGERAGAEVVQLYLRDLFAQPVRPVRELKAFRKIRLNPGESRKVEFALTAEDFAFSNQRGERLIQPGRFAVWVGGDSSAPLGEEFKISAPDRGLALSTSIAPDVSRTATSVGRGNLEGR